MTPLIWDTFQFHKLTEIMRQIDAAFAESLNEICIKSKHMLTKCCKLMNCNLEIIICYTQNTHFMCMLKIKMQYIGIANVK